MPSTLEEFAPLVGSRFRTEWGGQETDLELVEVTPLPRPRRHDSSGNEAPATTGPYRQEPFSLFFRGPVQPFLPQQVHRLSHETASEPLEIFLVPIRRDEDSFLYQAVFA